MSILGTRAELVFDLNLILQIIIILILLRGAYFAKRKNNYRIHGKIMGLAIILNAVSISLVMGPRVVGVLNFLILNISELRSLVVILHAIIGSLAEILGILSVVILRPCGSKMGNNVRHMMRVTFTVWALSFLLGVAGYLAFYVV